MKGSDVFQTLDKLEFHVYCNYTETVVYTLLVMIARTPYSYSTVASTPINKKISFYNLKFKQVIERELFVDGRSVINE